MPKNLHAYYTDWKSEEAVDLAQQGNRELDLAKREAMYKKIQAIHYDETPMIPIFHGTYPVVINKNVEGFVQTPLGNYRFENLVKKK